VIFDWFCSRISCVDSQKIHTVTLNKIQTVKIKNCNAVLYSHERIMGFQETTVQSMQIKWYICCKSFTKYFMTSTYNLKQQKFFLLHLASMWQGSWKLSNWTNLPSMQHWLEKQIQLCYRQNFITQINQKKSIHNYSYARKTITVFGTIYTHNNYKKSSSLLWATVICKILCGIMHGSGYWLISKGETNPQLPLTCEIISIVLNMFKNYMYLLFQWK
jgi:hypothetical protein